MRFVSILAIGCLLVLAKAQKVSHGKIVVCPVVTQSILDKFFSEFNIANINLNLCTNLIVIDHQIIGIDEVANEQKENDYKLITNLRNKYPHLTITVAVSMVQFYREYRSLAHDDNAAKNFVKNIVDYLKVRHFNGLDIFLGDLEDSLQTIETLSTESRKILQFLAQFQEMFHSHDLTLTSSFSSTTNFLSQKSDLSKYAQYFDLIHLLQLRAVSDRDHLKRNTVGNALKELNPSNVEQKIDNLIASGVPASKIVLGVNFGGPSAIATSNGNITTAKTQTIIGYNAICDILSSAESSLWRKSYDNVTKLSIVERIFEANNETHIILYGRSRTIANYMKLVVERNLAGALAFTIDMDDFNGQCGIDEDTFDDFGLNDDAIAMIFERIGTTLPLLKTMNEALTLTVENIRPKVTISTASRYSHGKIVACPIVTQSIINAYASDFNIENADWDLCTNLIVIDNQFVQIEGVSDEQREDDYKQLMNLRAKYAHLKITLAVSMLDFYKAHLSVAHEPNDAQHHLSTIADYLEYNGFDGLNLHFGDLNESLNEIDTLSMENDTVFTVLNELREKLQSENLSLTSSFSATVDYFATKFNFSKYAQHFDLIHLFQLRAVTDRDHFQENTVSHALRELNPTNVHQKIDDLIASGVPASKIVLGVNFGGPSATMSNADDPRISGNFTEAKTRRIVGYNVICEILSSAEASKWEKSLNHDTGLYLLKNVNEQNNEKNFIVYASSRMIANHMQFAVQRELAGALAFAIDMDDFKGQCKLDEDTFEDFEGITLTKRDGNTFQLLRTINDALAMAVDKRAQSGSNQISVNYIANGSAVNNRYNPIYVIFDLLGVLVSAALAR